MNKCSYKEEGIMFEMLNFIYYIFKDIGNPEDFIRSFNEE